MEGKCAFRKGHTTHEGRNTAPERCKKALAVILRDKIEICPITKPEDCPIKCFVDDRAAEVRP